MVSTQKMLVIGDHHPKYENMVDMKTNMVEMVFFWKEMNKQTMINSSTLVI